MANLWSGSKKMTGAERLVDKMLCLKKMFF